jgi:nucleoside-diphosphate-sugar epimerase
MRVLITGATGKIGKKLLDTLLVDEQNEIYALLTEKDDSELPPEIKICRGDLSELYSLRNALSNINTVNTVLHMAAITHSNNKKEYFSINLEGTKNLVKICEELGIKRIVFISSRAACSGGGDYAESKLAAENVIKKSKLEWLILALGEVYSISGNDEINRLFKTIKKNYFIPIIGNGEYKLAPVYIEDVVPAIMEAVNNENLSSKRYIICGKEEFSYRELVVAMVNFISVKRLIFNIPLLLLKFIFFLAHVIKIRRISYDQLNRLMVAKPSDISESIKDLGFNPRKFLEVLKLF